MFSGLWSRVAAIAGARAWSARGATSRGVFVAVALVSACTSDNVMGLRPEVDVGTQTAAVPADAAIQDVAANDPYLQPVEAGPVEAAPAAGPGEPVDSGLASMSQSGGAGQQFGMAEPVEANAAANSTDEPVVTAGYPQLDEPSATGQPAETTEPSVMSEPAGPADQPVLLAGYPHVDNPVESGPPPMPADEVACRRELKSLGVSYRELAPINDGGACRIDYPVKVSGLPDRIALKPAATLNCEMALTLAKWTENELNPAARRRYWSRVATIHQMSSYSCRRIAGSHSMSEHAKGNAIDIGRIELTSGRDIDVEKPGLFSFRTRGFLNNVRADGCEYFTTVLGPGYNYDHRNHFHFDIKPRRNGRHACH